MRVIRRIALAGAAIVALLGIVAAAARFADEPIGPFPAGAMSGELVADAPPDWRAVGDTIELQIRPSDPWSLRTYAIPHGGELYVPSFHAARRRWVPVALADPRVLVRVDGRLYERTIEPVTDPALRAALAGEMATRHGYAADGMVASDSTWYFHLAPRRDTAGAP